MYCWKRKDYSEKAQETGFPSKLEEQHFHQLTVTINSKERGWKLRDSDNQKVSLAFGIRFSWQKSWWQLTGCEKGGKIGAVSLGDTRKRHERQRVNAKCGEAAGTPLSFFFSLKNVWLFNWWRRKSRNSDWGRGEMKNSKKATGLHVWRHRDKSHKNIPFPDRMERIFLFYIRESELWIDRWFWIQRELRVFEGESQPMGLNSLCDSISMIVFV